MSKQDLAMFRKLLKPFDDKSTDRADLLVDAAAIHILVRGQGKLRWSSSFPLPHNSPAQELLKFVQSVALANQREVDFDGFPPENWLRHEQ